MLLSRPHCHNIIATLDLTRTATVERTRAQRLHVWCCGLITSLKSYTTDNGGPIHQAHHLPVLAKARSYEAPGPTNPGYHPPHSQYVWRLLSRWRIGAPSRNS